MIDWNMVIALIMSAATATVSYLYYRSLQKRAELEAELNVRDAVEALDDINKKLQEAGAMEAFNGNPVPDYMLEFVGREVKLEPDTTEPGDDSSTDGRPKTSH